VDGLIRVRRLLRKHEFYLAGITLALVLGIGLANPAFFSLANFFDLCQSSTVMGLFALGVLMVLLSGGIDVSFTAVGAFSMYVTARVLVAADFQGSVVMAFLMGGLIGLLLGLLNGVFIAVYRLPTLIVTLGSASVFRGFLLAFVGTTIVNQLPPGMVRFSKLTLGCSCWRPWRSGSSCAIPCRDAESMPWEAARSLLSGRASISAGCSSSFTVSWACFRARPAWCTQAR
jgi:ribose/xylose/arabinose/galactoside ABC-type transport system permease subunit